MQRFILSVKAKLFFRQIGMFICVNFVNYRYETNIDVFVLGNDCKQFDNLFLTLFLLFQINKDLNWVNKHIDQNWWVNYKGVREGPVKNPFKPKIF